MYSEVWSRGLRQGDVIGPISLPVLGVQFEVLFPSRSLVEQPPYEGARIVVPAASALVAIISHDCEFNEGKRNKLLVARLQSIPGNFTPEQQRDLRESNDIEARAAQELPIAGVDSWVFAPIPEVFEAEQVANFGTITPLPMKLAGELLGRKQAELLHEHRVRLRTKLAWFVGRDADDVPAEEKQAPPAREG